MPATPTPSDQWFGQLLAQLKQQVGGLSSGGTTYIVDPTIQNPSASNPNCTVIVGDVRRDNFNTATSLPASGGRSPWGVAVRNIETHEWPQL